jgi:cytochrome c oxidase subunit III
MPEDHADHFESLDVQRHAARLGMWVFLCSEVLLFAGLFALYAAYRALDPHGFREGVVHAAKPLGSINVVVLLVSSTTVALAVEATRGGKRIRAVGLVVATAALGVVFLGIKAAEYAKHLREGVHPGGGGPFFADRSVSAVFWTLYYVMTGLHAVHVLVGVGLLTWMAVSLHRGSVDVAHSYRVDLVALYWHLIDVVWIFLWPLFYLA